MSAWYRFGRQSWHISSSRKLCTAFMAVLLVGCKIQIIVPAGGTVTSASGSYTCTENSICEIDVIDIFFNETFTATPGSGYTFVAWQAGSGVFCGKSTNPCTLSTLGFDESAPLLSILESDQVFFLKPYFAELNGTQPLLNAPIKDCFDENMYMEGYSYDVTRQLYDDDGAERGTTRTEASVSGPVDYMGQPVMTLTEFVTNTGPLNSTLELVSYSTVNLAKREVITLAIDQESFTPVPQLANATLSPGFLQRFNLVPGQSYATSYTLNVSSPDDGFAPQTREITTEITYEGIENITIPAGSFNACRVHRFDTIDGEVSESYNWIGEGNGLLLRESESDFTPAAEILSGSINGEPL